MSEGKDTVVGYATMKDKECVSRARLSTRYDDKKEIIWRRRGPTRPTKLEVL